jgi:hypothetical protein
MMFAYGERNIMLPEFDEPVRLFATVLVNAQIDPRRKRINETRGTAGWIKGLGIGEVIYQFYKIPGHFVRV